jgi:hypothetical protein
MNEYEQHKALGDEAKRYIVENPVAFVVRAIKKAFLLHIKETAAISWNQEGIKSRIGESTLLPLKLLHQGYWIAMLVLAMFGTLLMLRDRGFLATLTHPVLLTWVYFAAVYAVVVVGDRYHLPSHPLIGQLAAMSTLAIARWSSSAKSRIYA